MGGFRVLRLSGPSGSERRPRWGCFSRSPHSSAAVAVARTRQPGAHLGRALCSTLAFLFFFASVRYLPLADAVAVEFGGPFLVVALSVPILGERVDRGRWLAVVVGFIGMILIVQPEAKGIRPEALLIIASSACYAFMMVLTRWMARRSGGVGAHLHVPRSTPCRFSCWWAWPELSSSGRK